MMQLPIDSFHTMCRAGFVEVLGRFWYLLAYSGCACWLMTDHVLEIPKVAVPVAVSDVDVGYYPYAVLVLVHRLKYMLV